MLKLKIAILSVLTQHKFYNLNSNKKKIQGIQQFKNMSTTFN